MRDEHTHSTMRNVLPQTLSAGELRVQEVDKLIEEVVA
jgi:hypothetical protein